MGDLASFLRLVKTVLVLSRYDALLPSDLRGIVPNSMRVLGFVARFGLPVPKGGRGQRLAAALEKLGPSYVKLGQFMATRGDILSADVVAGLSGLKDKMSPFAMDVAQEVLIGAFGENWATQIKEFSPAVAAASIAQVHKATDQNGTEIAVKILRPGIEQRIAKDIQALQLGAKLAEKYIPSSKRLEPVQFANTVAKSLELELDLRMEAAAASELAEIADQVGEVIIPQINWPLTRERVLVMDWLDGIALSDLGALRAANVDLSKLAALVPTQFLSFALHHGVFHADLHEGNMFACKDGKLGLVDFGIVGRIGPRERRFLAEILYGFLRRDYRRVAEVHFEAGYVPSTHLVDEFAQALRAVGEPVFGKTAKDVSMGQLLLHLFAVTARFDMHLRPELVLLQKTMVQVEGVARALDPDHDLWSSAAPVVEEYIRRELGPEGKVNALVDDVLDLRDALRTLPQSLQHVSQIAKQTKDEGFRLSAQSIQQMARANARAHRLRDIGILAGGAALFLAAVKFVFLAG